MKDKLTLYPVQQLVKKKHCPYGCSIRESERN